MTRNVKAVAMMVAAGLGLAAMPAMAGEFSFGLNLGRGGRDVAVGISVGRPAVVAPVQQVWVEPVYQAVTERVWVPTTHTEYRDVPVTDQWGRVISYRREAYTVQSGYWQEVQKQVLIRAGHYTTAPVVTTALPVAVHAGGRIAVRDEPQGKIHERDLGRSRDPRNNGRQDRNERGRTDARHAGHR